MQKLVAQQLKSKINVDSAIGIAVQKSEEVNATTSAGAAEDEEAAPG